MLTLCCHTVQPRIFIGMRMQWRPRSNVDLLPQADGVVLEQGLYMLPAAERSHATHTINLAYIIEARTTRVTVDCTLHVRGLELAALHDNGAGGRNGALRDIKRVVVVLGEAEDDGDVGFAGGGADLRHLWRVVGERVFDVFGCQ
jgi:hypothetical protein